MKRAIISLFLVGGFTALSTMESSAAVCAAGVSAVVIRRRIDDAAMLFVGWGLSAKQEPDTQISASGSRTRLHAFTHGTSRPSAVLCEPEVR